MRTTETLRALLGCRYPLVLAGMGGVARSELVGAVTAAGGFGFLGMVREPASLLEAEVARLRAEGHAHFGVNLIPAATEPVLLARQVDACLRLAVPAVCLFWDLDAALVARLRDAGVLVVYQVGSAAEAAVAERAGAAIVIAQGVEAGGHVRGRQRLYDLLPEVIAATTVPVLAAGGIASGADIATAMALGADGAVLGTAMIATHEAFAHPYHKQRLLTAGAADTVLTERFHINWPAGAAVRVLRSAVTAATDDDGVDPRRIVIGEDAGRPIVLHSTDSPLRTTTGSLGDMALYAGQGVGHIRDIVSAGARLAALAEEAEAVLAVPGGAVLSLENSSPVCYAGSIGAEYMGLLGRDELLARLNGLLEVVRARLRSELAADAASQDHDQRLVRWAVRLARLLEAIGGASSRRDLPTAAGAEQRSITAELRLLLPLVADDCVRDPLEAMLAEFSAATP